MATIDGHVLTLGYSKKGVLTIDRTYPSGRSVLVQGSSRLLKDVPGFELEGISRELLDVALLELGYQPILMENK